MANISLTKKGKPFIIDAPPEGTVEITETNEDDQKLFADAISVLKSLDDTSRQPWRGSKLRPNMNFHS